MEFPSDRYSVFISYRRADSERIAEQLWHSLSRRLGVDRVFFDRRSMPAGGNFHEIIDDVLYGNTYILLAVIGPEWAIIKDQDGRRRLDDENDKVRREISTAQANGANVIPILIGDTQIPSKLDLPAELSFLSDLHAESIRPGHETFDIVRLTKSLCGLNDTTTSTSRALGEPMVGLNKGDKWDLGPNAEPNSERMMRSVLMLSIVNLILQLALVVGGFVLASRLGFDARSLFTR